MLNSKSKKSTLSVSSTTNGTPMRENNGINIITVNTKIEGTITVESDLRLDGEVEGNINGNGDSKVVIGSKGTLKGTLTCKNAEINGKVIGSLTISEKLTVREKASISGGEIKVKTLIVEPEATINANCIMRKDPTFFDDEEEILVEQKKEERAENSSIED